MMSGIGSQTSPDILLLPPQLSEGGGHRSIEPYLASSAFFTA